MIVGATAGPDELVDDDRGGAARPRQPWRGNNGSVTSTRPHLQRPRASSGSKGLAPTSQVITSGSASRDAPIAASGRITINSYASRPCPISI
jgi:hypothetical protein